MAAYIGLEEAVSVCCDSIQALDSEYLHIGEALMRVAADHVTSFIDVPCFDRSSMDGYAIARADMEKLMAGNQLPLQVTATIGAGSVESRRIKAGEAYRIMTGALLPEGSAAVVKQEDVQTDGNLIVVRGSRKPGENIRKAGHELRAGERVAAKGQVLRPEVLERIAACGIGKVRVYRVPRVYVIDTGSELLLPGSHIETGKIYNSGRFLISGKIAGTGAAPLSSGSIVEDDLEAIANEIEKAADVSDLVIISGGTGNGDFDLVYKAFERINARPLFRGMGVNPGKGTAAALFNGRLLFNLPGNPYAAGLIFDALIKPALIKLKGDLFSSPEWFDIPLGSPIRRAKPGRSLCRGEMVIKTGRVYAQPLSKKGNGAANIPLLLDLKAGQGAAGDMARAQLS
ncbi:MAG: molybdopterin molybdotransferase MoeA [Firmicutes bacterium]|nr:molybdopterin molybdotransferase MoeA [Bacillota bacterium]